MMKVIFLSLLSYLLVCLFAGGGGYVTEALLNIGAEVCSIKMFLVFMIVLLMVGHIHIGSCLFNTRLFGKKGYWLIV